MRIERTDYTDEVWITVDLTFGRFRFVFREFPRVELLRIVDLDTGDEERPSAGEDPNSITTKARVFDRLKRRKHA